MFDKRARELAVYAVALVLVVVLGARWLAREPATPPAVAAAGRAGIRVENSSRQRLTVHVAGAVRRPGVYRLRGGARVNDAVRRAGGPTAAADLTQVNLAAELQDGRQVLLPARTTGQGGAGGAAGSPSAPGVPLNLNTATPEQLDELEGIGPATAKQIVEFRTAKGGFGSVDELADVPGIGDKRLATLREQVRV